jgi:hypothetical protein
MNALDNVQGTSRVRLTVLLPFLLMALIALVNMFFCMASIMPQWQIYQDLTAQVEAGRDAITQMEQQVPDDSAAVLEAQIDRARANLDEAASIFMTEDQRYDRLGRLYTYANESQTEIITVRAQPSTQESENAAYEVGVWRLQVEGAVPRLMDFIMLFREATLPSVIISNLSITEIDEGHSSLVMDVSIYISSHATGEAFTDLP